ncbi:hypothetical protein WJX84_007256 [Apatococcus fuscideae]|uniref:alpha-1,2-Mannosidase n=1 Tax=Apatococcus fuscideae TaxID=2026836 RepID=A0AAW1SNK0_9CHLO
MEPKTALAKKININSSQANVQRCAGMSMIRLRQTAIRNAAQLAFDGYQKYAFGHDEVEPVSQGAADPFGHVGMTILDGIDTLYIMGLTNEYQAARNWISTSLSNALDQSEALSAFETNIRVVGGLMAINDLDPQSFYVDRASQLVKKLQGIFVGKNPLPFTFVNLESGNAYSPYNDNTSVLSEMTTLDLEWAKVGAATGDTSAETQATNVVQTLLGDSNGKGLLPTLWSPTSGNSMTSALTVGGRGDSFYEYLLKYWILRGKSDDSLRAAWVAAMDAMTSQLVRRSTPSNYAYIGTSTGGQFNNSMDIFTCFVPGMLTLGITSGAVTGSKADQYLQLAEDVAQTCHMFYASQPSGLAGEMYIFPPGQDLKVDPGQPESLQRPEAVEGWFYLWRHTGNQMYRDWAWDVFQAWIKNGQSSAGFSGILDVTKGSPSKDNLQQSFFLAELLKYEYLIHGPDTELPLDKWVFNTEAHPFKIIGASTPAVQAQQGPAAPSRTG